MPLQAPQLAPPDPRVPWDRSCEADPYASYSAWESWLYDNMDMVLPEGCPAFLDELDSTHKAFLYSLMTRLALGEFAR